MSQDSFPTGNSKTENAANRKSPRKKVTKKITTTYLHNSGLYYLERFSSSSANFHAVMMRKVKRSCMAHPEQDYEECGVLVDQLVEKFLKVGLIDDEAYTRGMVTSLRRQGKSARFIHARLRAKGVESSATEKALALLDAENHENPADAERQAALTFARKKKIGPYRGYKQIDEQKELGRMARAGFSYDTSRSVLNLKASEIP